VSLIYGSVLRQEDIDFTSQLWRHARVVGLNSIFGFRLGAKSGPCEQSEIGVLAGCQSCLPYEEGTVPPGFALELMGWNVLANLTKSLWPEPYIDRRGRLKGNLLRVGHLTGGRIAPEYILKL
jgi:hypothetical protein